MTATILPTPADLSITPRDRRFGRGAATARLWHGGRVEATAIYNALSTTFPAGEAFFVESVRASGTARRPSSPRKSRPSRRRKRSTAASMTRSTSARASAGYDLSKLEAQVEKRLAITQRRPPIVSLAATMALEHFTAILAHQLLANPRHLAGGSKRRPTCGAGMRSRRSSTRASPTIPGFTRPATGRGGSAGRSRRRSCCS